MDSVSKRSLSPIPSGSVVSYRYFLSLGACTNSDLENTLRDQFKLVVNQIYSEGTFDFVCQRPRAE